MTIGRTETGTTRAPRGLCLEHGKLNGTLSRIPSGPAADVKAVSKAGHMPAPDQTVINQKATCQQEAVHTCPRHLPFPTLASRHLPSTDRRQHEHLCARLDPRIQLRPLAVDEDVDVLPDRRRGVAEAVA